MPEGVGLRADRFPGLLQRARLPYDCGASAPGQSLRGPAGSPTSESTTSPVSPDTAGAFRGAVSNRLQTFSSENICAALGSHQFRPRAGFRFGYQVTVASIGLPIEGGPLRRNALPTPENANRRSGTAPASAARPSVPGQRTSLERLRNAASRRSVELAQLDLVNSGCSLDRPRLVEVQVPPGTLRTPVSSELEYEDLLRKVGAI